MGQIETFTAADFVPAGAQLGREPSPESDALLPETFPSVFDQLPDGIALARVVGRSAPLLYVNSAFEELTGYTREEALGKDCRYLQGSDRDQPELERLREAMAAALPVDVTVRNFRKDGSAFWNRVSL